MRPTRRREVTQTQDRRRKGAIVPLAALMMILVIAMIAFAVDVGYIVTAQTEAQRTADAAAFAGAGALGFGKTVAVDTAREFAGYNTICDTAVTGDMLTVEAGNWDPINRTFSDTLDRATAVRVVVQQDKQPLFFGGLLGIREFDVDAEAVATYSPRDIVVVLDYSASMNDDSELRQLNVLGRSQIEGNLYQIYQELGAPKFGNMQWEPQYIYSDNASSVKWALGLNYTPYPFPSGSWDDYIYYVRTNSYIATAGYRKYYGYLTLVNYWLERQPTSYQTPTLWKTSEQPITAVKDALKVFLAYLQEVDTDDRVGLAIYTSTDGTGKLEVELTADMQKVEDISRQRQAGHYHQYTNIGAGLQKAREELEKHGRVDALKMIVLMTDGIANRPNGTADARQYVRDEADLAAKDGFPILTISLGANADTDLMQEVADTTMGVHFNIPGGQSVDEYKEDLNEVFRQIAGHRPLRLVK